MRLTGYWAKHPMQARLSAAFLLVTSPVAIPLLLVIEHWDEVISVYAELFGALTHRREDAAEK